MSSSHLTRQLVDQLHSGEQTVESLIGAIMIWHSEAGCNDSKETYELIMAEALKQTQAQLVLMNQEPIRTNPLREFVLGVHQDLLESERADREKYPNEPVELYYTDRVTQYAVDQDNASLEAAEALLEQNIRESYLDDGMLTDLCFEVLREEVWPAVVPDDEP